MFKLVLEKADEPEIKLPTSAGSLKKQACSRKTVPKKLFYKNIFCFIDKAFDCVDHNKTWKILKEMGIWYREICTQIRKKELEPYMEQWIDSKLGKKHVKAVHVILLI